MNSVDATVVTSVDQAFLFIVGISTVLLLGITAVMIYFVVKFSRKRHPQAVQIKESKWLEITWTAIPTVLVLAMFYYGYQGFALMRNAPDDTFNVKVTARMWDWSFEYENGLQTDKLYVPVDRAIKLDLQSLDVLHSFYLPSFRVKEDVVPGKETYLWFKPQSTGPADIFCAEYCGQRHAYMISQVIVMETDEFQRWYASGGEVDPQPLVTQGLNLLGKYDCLGCHGLQDKIGDAPVFAGIFGRETVVLEDGKEKTVTADETYLRRAITDPAAEIVKGYLDEMDKAEEMPPEDLEAIIDYLKTVKEQ